VLRDEGEVREKEKHQETARVTVIVIAVAVVADADSLAFSIYATQRCATPFTARKYEKAPLRSDARALLESPPSPATIIAFPS